MGLLGEQKPAGLFGFLQNPDARARLAVALEGMTLNPNIGYMTMLNQGVQDRRETKRTTDLQNKTAAWLRQRGRDDLAAAVEAGALSGSDAANIAMQPAPQPEPVRGVEINGKLVNPITGQVIGDFATPATPDPVKGVEIDGRLVNPITGELIADYSTQEPAFRRATPDEAKQYGATAGQFGPDGRFYPIDVPQGMTIESDGAGGFRMVQGAGVGLDAKPFTEAQSKDIVFATRAQGALEVLDPIASELTNRASRAAEYDPTGLLRGAVQSDQFQIAKNAGDEFLQALLRKDSGAAITPSEQALYGVTYLPQPGDNQALIEAKKAARARAVEAIKAGMAPSQIIAQEKALGGGATAIPTVKNDADYDALPSGSQFIAPDGSTRRKP